MIIIDTDVLIEILDKKSDVGQIFYEKIKSSKHDISITVITLHEILYGFLKYQKASNQVLEFHILEYNKNDAELSAKLEIEMEEKQGAKIPRTDTMIAAIAINNNAILFSRDHHFTKLIPLGLKLLD